MKEFVKMTLATIAGLFIFGFVAMFLAFAMIGALAAVGDSQPVMPREGILTVDMSTFMLAEQTKESDPIEMLSSGGQSIAPLGIWSAINAVNAAAADPAIKFIYLKPDGINGNTAQIEEFRKVLKRFRETSGKAIVAYTESPGNANYYIASVADKIYMTPHDGAINTFSGISSQLIFLKDIFDKLGINMQLIRHGKGRGRCDVRRQSVVRIGHHDRRVQRSGMRYAGQIPHQLRYRASCSCRDAWADIRFFYAVGYSADRDNAL